MVRSLHVRHIRALFISERRLNMSEKRRDNKGRILRTGESQRKNGMYEFRYTDANKKRRSIYDMDLMKLRQKEDEIKLLRHEGIDYAGGEITVIQLLERYISLKRGVRYNTTTGYKFVMSVVKKESFGQRIIRDIKMSDAKLWFIKLYDDGYSYSTIASIRGVVKPAFQMAYTEDIIRRNPFEFRLDIIPNNTQKRVALSPKQQEQFLEFTKNDKHFCRYLDEIKILLGTGMRISDDDDKIRLNQRKPSKYKGLSRFGPEKNLQRINKFMKERPTFYKKLIQMKENFRFYLRCFYCITKVVILQFNSEKQDRISS